MKLKRFNEFIAINESIQEFEVEEQLFMIDGEIYEVSQIDVDLSWEREPADPEVGIPSAFDYVDGYEISGVTRALKLTNLELKESILDLLDQPSDDISTELADFGFKEEVGEDRIYDIAFSGDWQQDWQEVTGEELKAFSNRFINLYRSNQLKQIVGNLSTTLQTDIDNIEPDHDGSDDYDDYDDRY
jgi:hypothetical protein